MWREVPPGVSSFHPPSPSSSFLPFFFFLFFFILYERQSLLPNTEAPQELIIQKTRAPQRTKRTRVGGGWEKRRKKKRWSKDEGWCKGGNRVFACVCVLSSLLMNVKSLSEPRGILHIPQASLLWLPLLYFPSHWLWWTMPDIPAKLSTNYLLNMFVHVGWAADLIEGGGSTFPVLNASSVPSKQRRYGGRGGYGLRRVAYLQELIILMPVIMCFAYFWCASVQTGRVNKRMTANMSKGRPCCLCALEIPVCTSGGFAWVCVCARRGGGVWRGGTWLTWMSEHR